MDKIELLNVLPEVFANRDDIAGDVWKQSVVFEKGHSYLLEANSGTGKSSLCSFVFGYRHDYRGNILFDGTDVRTYTISNWVDVRRRSLAMLWQDLRLFPELTALENVQIKNSLTGKKKKKQILEWFEMLGISDKLDTPIGIMSFGQQQRVAMMRTLCQPFDFVMVDEPISHLDDTNGRIMAGILTDEAKAQGAGVIVTSIGKRMELNYDKIYRL